MIAGILKVFCVSVFFSLCCYGTSFSMTEEEAAQQWDAVRGTAEETTVLMELFKKGGIPGNFLHTVKERFYEIATPADARVLLKMWVDQNMREHHLFADVFLRELKGDEFTELFEEYLYIASDERTQKRLFEFITQQDSLDAFRAALKYIHYIHEKGHHRQVIFYIEGMRGFKHPEIRQEIIDGTASVSSITRAASYIALRNYPDDEVLAIIEDALTNDIGIIPGEENRVIPERYIKSGKAGGTLIQDILKTNKMKIERYRKYNKGYQENLKDSSFYRTESDTVSADSSDEQLAIEYAPQILLSDGGAIGVDIQDDDYPYTDYIPMYVNNVTKMDRKTVYLNLAEVVSYQGTTYGPGNVLLGRLDYIGDPVFRSSSNYLDFSPAWEDYWTVADGYKALTVYPSVYYKVFKDPGKENSIAVQYWFFYYYNDWLNNHPGDWETITVFLDTDAQPVEAIFSTHYEANKYSWNYVERSNNTHPKVYVSNGGHGSYNFSGDTSYSILGINDNHKGDKEVLNPEDYFLLSLSTEEGTDDSWIWFEGRWGDEDSAPQGPHFRTDAPTPTDWGRANNPPYDPENGCVQRYAARIYGDDDHPGPWHWASGYGLNTPWTSTNDCKIGSFKDPLTSILYILLFNQTSAASASAAAEKIK
jgi:hypothetical protein